MLVRLNGFQQQQQQQQQNRTHLILTERLSALPLQREEVAARRQELIGEGLDEALVANELPHERPSLADDATLESRRLPRLQALHEAQSCLAPVDELEARRALARVQSRAALAHVARRRLVAPVVPELGVRMVLALGSS